MRIRWLADVVVRIPFEDETIVLGKGIEAVVPETEYFQNAIASGYAEEILTVAKDSELVVIEEVVNAD
ncbi:MAG: hypothetical protein F6K47_32285 [Symploca sp. SIO2E6]|nr:hypothetical protein [Symploca sp. SIO2E6]